MKHVATSFSVHERLKAATEFLAHFANNEVLILAPTRAAADELARGMCAQSGGVFGVHRFTLLQFAIQAATKRLVEAGKTILGGVAVDALAARAVYECRKRGNLQWFESVARTPGFFKALASTISELRLNNIEPAQLKQLLLIIHKRIIPYMNKPQMLMDWLTDSYNSGDHTLILADE